MSSVCMVYVSVCMCVQYTYICIHTCLDVFVICGVYICMVCVYSVYGVCVSSRVYNGYFQCFFTLFLNKALSLNLELTGLVRLVGSKF